MREGYVFLVQVIRLHRCPDLHEPLVDHCCNKRLPDAAFTLQNEVDRVFKSIRDPVVNPSCAASSHRA